MQLIRDKIKDQLKNNSKNIIENSCESWFYNVYIKRKFSLLKSNNSYNLENNISDNKNEFIEDSKNRFDIGKMYMFFYNNPKVDQPLHFFDTMIIGLYLGNRKDNGNALFLALQHLPEEIRIKILDEVILKFNKEIDRYNESLNKGILNSKPILVTYQLLEKISNKYGYDLAIRSYNVKRIKTKPLVVSYLDWWKLCLLNRNFLKKMNTLGLMYVTNKKSVENYINEQLNKLF